MVHLELQLITTWHKKTQKEEKSIELLRVASGGKTKTTQ